MIKDAATDKTTTIPGGKRAKIRHQECLGMVGKFRIVASHNANLPVGSAPLEPPFRLPAKYVVALKDVISMSNAKRKRNRAVTVRMNDCEYDRLQKKVSESGLSQQAYIIGAVCNAKITSSDEVAVLKDLSRLFADHERQVRGMATNINQMAKVANSQGSVAGEEELERISGQISDLRKESEEIWQSIRSSITGLQHMEQ